MKSGVGWRWHFRRVRRLVRYVAKLGVLPKSARHRHSVWVREKVLRWHGRFAGDIKR